MELRSLLIGLSAFVWLSALSLLCCRICTSQPVTERSLSPGLDRSLSRAEVSNGTFVKALFQVGRLMDQCVGVVLVQRTSAATKVPGFITEKIKVGALLERILQTVPGFEAKEESGCIVVGPVGRRPKYLKTVILRFKTKRDAVELQSYYLFQALSAAMPQPAHKGGWGMISSISSSTDSPQLGPIDLKAQSVESILCAIAREARSTMWVAFPSRGEQKTPWLFVGYRYGDQTVNTIFRAALDDFPE
jgi:hypothetical protein